jgi:hypothetical protein
MIIKYGVLSLLDILERHGFWNDQRADYSLPLLLTMEADKLLLSIVSSHGSELLVTLAAQNAGDAK